RATQRLAPRLVARAAIETGLRHGLQRPVVDLAAHHDDEPARRMNQGARVRSAGLDQADADERVLAQPGGDHAARRACTDDHIVEALFVHALVSPWVARGLRKSR